MTEQLDFCFDEVKTEELNSDFLTMMWLKAHFNTLQETTNNVRKRFFCELDKIHKRLKEQDEEILYLRNILEKQEYVYDCEDKLFELEFKPKEA